MELQWWRLKYKKKTNLQPTWRKWYITNRLQNHHAYFNKLSVGESNSNLIKWLIDSILLYVPLEYFTLIWRRHNCQWRTAEFRPLFGSSSGIFSCCDTGPRCFRSPTKDWPIYAYSTTSRGYLEPFLTQIPTGIWSDEGSEWDRNQMKEQKQMIMI